MYFTLSEALKRRFIYELQRYWQYHPRHRDIVNSIQGKFSFEERPQRGIVVRAAGGNRFDLSADNYVGMLQSYVYLTKVSRYPGLAVEWVREDSVAIQDNDGHFPSAPGVYFIELTEDEEFYVDPLYDVRGEVVTEVNATTYQLQNAPLAGTLRLFEMPAAYRLFEGTNYTLTLDAQGKPTGEIVLNQALTGGRTLSADYRWPGTSQGPITLYPGCANNQAIPGVVLAFGRRNEKGDRMAVVVQERRQPAALEYGGRWQMSMEFEVMARDVYDQMEIADQSIIYLWGVARSYLVDEGIHITDLSHGGEAEEVYDENGDDYFYTASFSMTVETDWSIHVPLDVSIRRAAPLTQEQARAAAAMTDEQVSAVENNLQMLENLGLQQFCDPYFADRTRNYEVIR